MIKNHYFDGMKNQISAGQKLNCIGNIYMAITATQGQTAAWVLNLGITEPVPAGIYHRAEYVAGIVGYDTLAGGINAERHRSTNLDGGVFVDVGRYGVRVTDFAGEIQNFLVDGANYNAYNLSVATGERLNFRDSTAKNYGKNIAGQTDTSLKAAVRLLGAGTTRVSGVRVDSVADTTTPALHALSGVAVELDGSNSFASAQPVIVEGSLTEINGDHIGPIFSDAAATTPFNFADGVVRKGKGPGRVFNASTPPASGSYRKGDLCYNTNPASGAYLGWICVADGMPGTWKGFGLIA